ncbi:hypothetical protein PIB30_072371, partial [Stylosanthes scabra]|nr:hypothetical protein [Stylosanthes scabra]
GLELFATNFCFEKLRKSELILGPPSRYDSNTFTGKVSSSNTKRFQVFEIHQLRMGISWSLRVLCGWHLSTIIDQISKQFVEPPPTI